ncbi:unnamed protein product [Arctia plantaginis]|uniref:Uncharacterized protein n=1 Tax=Arctia plantaginis TaxID=874455 RepID=A0A8S1APU4_ARCPL|nr:unnamed protein product [Arctia plantaginis]
MTACRISTCSNEACGENDKKDDESRIKTPYHKPSIFTPPLSLCDRIKLLKRKCVRAINIVYAASRKIYYNDRFTWQLLKSSILFVLGMKVFYDIYRMDWTEIIRVMNLLVMFRIVVEIIKDDFYE